MLGLPLPSSRGAEALPGRVVGAGLPGSLQSARELMFWSSYHLTKFLPIPCTPINFKIPQITKTNVSLAPLAANS